MRRGWVMVAVGKGGGSNVKLRCSVGGSESDTSGMADKKMEER